MPPPTLFATAVFLPASNKRLRIAYVLAQPELGGGNKVVFQHAQLLVDQGHRVTVLGEGNRPSWAEFSGYYLDYAAETPEPASQDLVIATFWTTLALARELNLGPMAHFCQGYEGSHSHNRPRWGEIEAAYRVLPLPSITVTPYLKDLLHEKFGRLSRVAPPPADSLFKPAVRLRPHRVPRIVIPGIFQAEVKGIPTAIKAVKLLENQGLKCRVTRISTLPLTAEECALRSPDTYLCAVSPERVAQELRRSDLLLMPSQPEEGFGLPLLEALCSKVPAVASRIPSTEYMADGAVELVSPGDSGAFAKATHRLLTNHKFWHEARKKGWNAAKKFHPAKVAQALEEAVQWASEVGIRQ